MRRVLAIMLASLFAVPIQAQQATPTQQNVQQVECRDLATTGNYLAPNETLINGKACRPAGTPLQVVDPTSKLAPAKPAPTPQSQQAPPNPIQVKQCLIVTSAEGHRFRNSMIAGVLTGGVGLAAGLAFSGGRYDYRDSYNLPPSDVKMKYKGPELQKLQQNGVHIIVVNKKDKTGDEVKDARTACQ